MRAPAGGLTAVLAAAVLALAPVPALGAQEEAPETGWWSRTKVGPPAPAPEAPDTVPDGGTQVAGDPTGTVSVAALRLALPPGALAAELRLPVARTVGTPQVEACPAAAAWRGIDGGRLEDAPAADCTAARSTGEVREGVLVVPVAALQRAGAVDVVLRPAPGSAFVLDLGPADGAAVVVSAPATVEEEPAPEPGAPVEEAGPLALAGPVLPPPVPDVAPPPVLVEAPVLPGAGEVPAELPPALPAPALPDPPALLPVSPPVVAAPAAALPTGRREQVAALALLAGLVALASGLRVQPARAPRALGGGARLRGTAPAAEVPAPRGEGGVGRFRGPRDRPPVRV